jgi:hypothetical protein
MSYRDKETLKTLYVEQRLDQSEIADQFNVSQGTISRWINRHNINRPLDDADYLKEMYHEEGMPLSEIADEIGCWPGSVGKAMERHGIERRVSSKEKLPTPRTNKYGHECWNHYDDGVQKSVYVHRLLAVAEYGTERVKGNDVHHTNRIAWDNRADNIEVLCRGEHNRRHLPERDSNGRFTD